MMRINPLRITQPPMRIGSLLRIRSPRSAKSQRSVPTISAKTQAIQSAKRRRRRGIMHWKMRSIPPRTLNGIELALQAVAGFLGGRGGGGRWWFAGLRKDDLLPVSHDHDRSLKLISLDQLRLGHFRIADVAKSSAISVRFQRDDHIALHQAKIC